jgi:uracil-DNA glycosylase
MAIMSAIQQINDDIVKCERCPRLLRHCQTVALQKRKSFSLDEYWGKPVPGFGDPNARIVIFGLAPAAHGANRTGRMFTGDRSGEWLYRALHKAGFSNQPTSVSREDGLQLHGVYLTASVRCAPPHNKPTPDEIKNCQDYLARDLAALNEVKVFIALGRIAFEQAWKHLGEGTRPPFDHGQVIALANGTHLVLSYHPSQQNTFTGRLTEPMFDDVFRTASALISK